MSHMTASWVRRRMREIVMEQFPGLDRSCRCYSATSSALKVLLSQPSSRPMLFQLRNPAADRELVSHSCRILELTALEDTIFIPSWKMKSLELEEGDVVQVKNVLLRKGTFIKLQPDTKDFLDITNPRAVLEKTLRSFSCFTVGDTIMLPYNGKEYYGKAICIFDTDRHEVDFAPPLDYVEPEKPAAPASRGKLVFRSNAANRATTTDPKRKENEASKEQAKQEEKEGLRFQRFMKLKAS